MSENTTSIFTRLALIADQLTTPSSSSEHNTQRRIAHALCTEKHGESACLQDSKHGALLRTAYRRLVQWTQLTTPTTKSSQCTRFGEEATCTTTHFQLGKSYKLTCDSLGDCRLSHYIQYGAVRAAGTACTPSDVVTVESDALELSDPLAQKGDLVDPERLEAYQDDEYGIQGWRFNENETQLQPSCRAMMQLDPEHPLDNRIADRVYIRGIRDENGETVISPTEAFQYNAESVLLDSLLYFRGYKSVSTFAPKHWMYVHASLALVAHPQDNGEVHWHSQYKNTWDDSFVSIIADPVAYSATLIYHHLDYDCWAVYEYAHATTSTLLE